MTVQGPVKKQPPDGMSHRGGGGVFFSCVKESPAHSGRDAPDWHWAVSAPATLQPSWHGPRGAKRSLQPATTSDHPPCLPAPSLRLWCAEVNKPFLLKKNDVTTLQPPSVLFPAPSADLQLLSVTPHTKGTPGSRRSSNTVQGAEKSCWGAAECKNCCIDVCILKIIRNFDQTFMENVHEKREKNFCSPSSPHPNPFWLLGNL